MFDKELQEKIDLVKDILITKNKCYGNSALEPIRIFSRADTIEQLKVRLDDKLSRLAKGKDVLEKDKDVIVDLTCERNPLPLGGG